MAIGDLEKKRLIWPTRHLHPQVRNLAKQNYISPSKERQILLRVGPTLKTFS
jgi:hypothetical protein